MACIAHDRPFKRYYGYRNNRCNDHRYNLTVASVVVERERRVWVLAGYRADGGRPHVCRRACGRGPPCRSHLRDRAPATAAASGPALAVRHPLRPPCPLRRQCRTDRRNLGRDQGSGPWRGCRSRARHRRVRGSAADGRPSRCDVAGDCAVLPARMALAMIDTCVGPNTVRARQGPAVVVWALRNGWPTVTSMCSACSHCAGDCALHPCIAG